MDKEKSVKARTGIIAVLVLIVALCLIAIRQYRTKTELQEKNRQLILQNDSILSANIELRKQLTQWRLIYFSVRNQKGDNHHGK